ncbi:Uma2 family endonuclease, partial [Candidatus Poribacteria bacterium]|nr:Uma2 family endonuclease [Candidatus Poribacteria bacterium]
MNILKTDPEQVVIPPTPIETDMTLEEFLESDLEGYEYVKGELIPMPPTSGEHGDISANLFLFLGTYVRENQLGRAYTSDTGFKVGDRFLIPD